MQHFLPENQDSLVKKAGYLRLKSAELAEGIKSGNFRSLYRGQGVEFSGVRDYIRGDDVRSIDWNVTARMGRPYVKMFEEERELQLLVIVDSSASMRLGEGGRTKYRSAAEAAALLALAAEMNGCPLGAVLFDGEITFSARPQAGREQTMLILSRLDRISEKPVTGSCLDSALAGAGKLLRKTSMVFVFSDFRCAGWEKPLAVLAHKNDVIAFRLLSPEDERLPAVGTALFEDAESGQLRRFPTFSDKFRKAWRAENERRTKNWQDFCTDHGVYPFVMNADDEPLSVLSMVFERHAKRE